MVTSPRCRGWPQGRPTALLCGARVRPADAVVSIPRHPLEVGASAEEKPASFSLFFFSFPKTPTATRRKVTCCDDIVESDVSSVLFVALAAQRSHFEGV